MVGRSVLRRFGEKAGEKADSALIAADARAFVRVRTGSGRFDDGFERAYTDILESDDHKATPYAAASVPMERDGCPLSQFGIASADCFLKQGRGDIGVNFEGKGNWC